MRDGAIADGTAALAEPVTLVTDALAVPERRDAIGLLPAGIVDSAGAPVFDSGGFWLRNFVGPGYVDRSTLTPATRHAGTWLFGGAFRPHFGHFLLETISRLWAYDALRGQVEGIVFFRPKAEQTIAPHLLAILHLLDIDAPIRFIDTPTAFDRLYVPRQGAAVGPLATGTPAFRAFVKTKLSRIAPRTDAPRIYLSREGYRLRRGGLFDEEMLSGYLKAEGYIPFSPERASFEEQIATYRGASHVIGPDSSAMHLLAYVAAPETRIGVILRRHDGARDILPQIAGFTGRPPTVIDAITRLIRRDTERNPNWSLLAEIDFSKVWADLLAAGFITGKREWRPSRATRRDRLLASYAAMFKSSFTTVWQKGDPLAPPATTEGTAD